MEAPVFVQLQCESFMLLVSCIFKVSEFVLPACHATIYVLRIGFLTDMQCCGGGQINECHTYFASVEAGSNLERPNVRPLFTAYCHCIYLLTVISCVHNKCF